MEREHTPVLKHAGTAGVREAVFPGNVSLPSRFPFAAETIPAHFSPSPLTPYPLFLAPRPSFLAPRSSFLFPRSFPLTPAPSTPYGGEGRILFSVLSLGRSTSRLCGVA